MTVYRYKPVRDLANSPSMGWIEFELTGWREPRIEEAKSKLIEILNPILSGLKKDPEKNRSTIDFINQQINRFPTSWEITKVKEKVFNNIS